MEDEGSNNKKDHVLGTWKYWENGITVCMKRSKSWKTVKWQEGIGKGQDH